MKKIQKFYVLITLIVALCLLTGCDYIFIKMKEPVAGKVLAFPGAEGFGADARGGRGGKVYIVTNLNDSGSGSLREAVEASGPRIVVFEVSGIIELKEELIIRNPYITIAGQTSPKGITLTNKGFAIETDHVVVRHLRVRLGDLIKQEKDSIEILRANNVILDHVTSSWGIDETLSVSDSDLVTIQWSIISEALNESHHEKGPHGYGSLIRGSNGQRVSFHHNLWAHNRGRNPRPGNYTSYKDDPIGFLVDIRNNVMYNWGGTYAGNNEDTDTITQYNFINNYYKPGPNSSSNTYAFRDNAPYAQGYFLGNMMNGNLPSDQWSLVSGSGPSKSTYLKATEPFPVAYVTTSSAEMAFDEVLAKAGAFPRDAIDARVVNDVRNRTGKIIDSQSEVVSAWPKVQDITTKTIDIDRTDKNRNGIPDWWEEEKGVKNGNHNQIMPSGYTAIEEYINWLADQLID